MDDHIGFNPGKGGLLHAGLLDNGERIAIGWSGCLVLREEKEKSFLKSLR